MKKSVLIAIGIIMFLVNMECFSQLIVDAGSDTAFCSDSQDSFSIGGNPTASGGASPYIYSWSGEYSYVGHIIRASDMLNDTTVANPMFLGDLGVDSIYLYVTVSDQNNVIEKDSILIRKSQYMICLGECRYDIKEGDSIIIGPCCVSGGIPPHEYLWTPAESLSDNTAFMPWAKPSETTSYNVTITDSIGCQAWSGCFVFVQPASIHDNSEKKEIVVFPNPTKEILHVQLNSEGYTNTHFNLIDVEGKTILNVPVSNPEFSLNLNGIEPGIYLYTWESKGKLLSSGKVIIR